MVTVKFAVTPATGAPVDLTHTFGPQVQSASDLRSLQLLVVLVKAIGALATGAEIAINARGQGGTGAPAVVISSSAGGSVTLSSDDPLVSVAIADLLRNLA